MRGGPFLLNMAKPVWQQKLQEKLDAEPLFFTKIGGRETFRVKHEKCLDPEETKGKKVSLRELVNYNLHTCAGCRKRVG